MSLDYNHCQMNGQWPLSTDYGQCLRNGQYQRSVVSVKSAKCWNDLVSVLTTVDVFYAESGKTVKMACYE